MSETSYVFEDTAADPERRRLEALEAVFDPGSRRWLAGTGPLAGRRCIEVGAGAGSIARWLGEQTAPGGSVVALDASVRFLASTASGNVEVIAGVLPGAPLAAAGADLAHARYVLVHNREPEEILRAMIDAVAPGGWIVLEEPDFSVKRALAGPDELREAFARVGRAIAAMFGAGGMDHALGSRLPALLLANGLVDLEVDHDAPIVRGGAELATMMAMSAEQLGHKYLATGEVSGVDLDGYRRFAHDPGCWGIYYGTVRVRARRPGP